MLEDIEQVPPELLDGKRVQELRSTLNEALECLNEAGGDEEELDELQALLVDLEQKLGDRLSARRESLRQDLNGMVLEVERAVIGLRRADVLDRKVEGQVAFVGSTQNSGVN